jgi:hypothetical protein
VRAAARWDSRLLAGVALSVEDMLGRIIDEELVDPSGNDSDLDDGFSPVLVGGTATRLANHYGGARLECPV